MGRSPCCSKVGLNRGAWTTSEDKTLADYIKLHGEGKWRILPKKAGLKRCGKSCRLRWLNYLRPDIKRGNISHDEEELIIRLHKLLGNRWSLIAGRLPGRTDNEIKNYWNTTLGKKVQDNYHNSITQTNEKTKKKTSKTEATHKDDSCVVRTKALRCSKTFFTPQPNEFNHPNEIPGKSNIPKENLIAKTPSEPGSPSWDSPFHPTEEKDDPSNFMLDVELWETTSFTELFSSDFKGVLDFNCGEIMNSHEPNEMSTSSSSDEPAAPFFSKEMLDHFSYIPDLGEDWLPQ